jgi:hypothetical protein
VLDKRLLRSLMSRSGRKASRSSKKTSRRYVSSYFFLISIVLWYMGSPTSITYETPTIARAEPGLALNTQSSKIDPECVYKSWGFAMF